MGALVVLALVGAYSWFVNPLLIALVFNAYLSRKVENPPILPAHRDSFPWTQKFEDNWRIIREELDRVLASREKIPPFQKVDSGQLIITRDQKWRTFFFKVYGVPVPHNCALCPKTSALIEETPEIVTAMFSILDPGKAIPPHRGPFRGVLRYHLGLLVPPSPGCEIRVADQTYRWQEGDGIVFDDTYRHEVRNDTEYERAILHVDFMRPLPANLDGLNRRVFDLAQRSRRVRSAARKAKVPFA